MRALVAATVAALIVGVVVGWFGHSLRNHHKASAAKAEVCVTHTSTPVAAGPVPKASTVTVNVYNATARAGLARTTGAELATRQFNVANVANDPLKATIAGSAVVRYGPKGLAQARLVAAQVPGATLLKDNRTDATVDLVIGNGFQAVATPAQVTAALNAKPQVTRTCT
jgi:LytR cell envelope-related transcriptional attenuator